MQSGSLLRCIAIGAVATADGVCSCLAAPSNTENSRMDSLMKPLETVAQSTKETKFSLPTAAHLDLLCRKCTRKATFTGATIPQAAQQSIEAGWVRENDGTPLGGYFVCPTCPAVRAHVSKRTGVTIGYGDHSEVLKQVEAVVEPGENMLA